MRPNRQIAKGRSSAGEEFFEEYCDLIELAKTISNCILKGQFSALENLISAFRSGRKDVDKKMIQDFIYELRKTISEILT
jgi:hypothetical protein